jgi:hypothetical protein
VLVFDPVDDPAIDERIRALGEPVAVIQLLDRHARDCVAIANRLGVPHLEMRLSEGTAPGAELLPVAWNRFWREAAFWEPARGILVVGDALGTVGYCIRCCDSGRRKRSRASSRATSSAVTAPVSTARSPPLLYNTRSRPPGAGFPGRSSPG